MAIGKNEFYEGAALHKLVRSGAIETIRCDSPYFVVNERVWIYLKYSTRGRSPWSFTFTAQEQQLIGEQGKCRRLILGLVCGADGVAALEYTRYVAIASLRETSIGLSCSRKYNEHYAISGPDGEMTGKIAPVLWQQVLNNGEFNESL
jgi:hypothetical protein